MLNWQASASREVLYQRSQIITKIREFFRERQVLEVDTPLLATSTVTDPYIHSIHVNYRGLASQRLYLQTSPEYAMKRLLASGSGDIYQICKAFREDEVGKQHNPEFTLLEWYRLDYDHHRLMDEVDDLLQCILAVPAAKRISYGKLFIDVLNIDPHTIDAKSLQNICKQQQITDVQGIDVTDKDQWLQILMSDVIEPTLIADHPVMVYDYPASQAALARLRPGDPPVAERFEVYYRGIELANGFHELSCAQQQRQRFERDLARRQQQGTECVAMDEALLAALEHGLPDCAGVALGVDRLIMLALGLASIQDVLAFPFQSI